MKRVVSTLCLSVIAIAVAVPILPATCDSQSAVAAHKKWTVYQRQVELRNRIAKGQKNNELTLKEFEHFNAKLDEIVADTEKYKSKNANKLSYKDEGKIEKRLNDLSLEIQKAELKKRVVPK